MDASLVSSNKTFLLTEAASERSRMSKGPSPLLGYNNNVRHKNRVFHIQTEDSGITRPHIITHLFMDGGRILKSTKTSYAQHVGVEGMADLVRQMMKEQHKAMFIALREGQFDPVIDGGVTAPPSSPSLAPTDGLKTSIKPPAASVPVEATASISAAALTGLRTHTTKSFEAPPVPSAASLGVDLGVLEQAAATLQDAAGHGVSGATARPSDLPPPPPNLFRKGEANRGRYRSVPPPAEPAVAAPPVQEREGTSPRMRGPVKRVPQKPAVGEKAGSGRYAPTRPASIFGSARPQQSIFGDDVSSDKSLDDVILSYLAEDLEGEK